jgi:hypothetical protein
MSFRLLSLTRTEHDELLIRQRHSETATTLLSLLEPWPLDELPERTFRLRSEDVWLLENALESEHGELTVSEQVARKVWRLILGPE